MSEDAKIDGINVSAMLRNFDTLRGVVKKQGETIATQKKPEKQTLLEWTGATKDQTFYPLFEILSKYNEYLEREDS